MACVAHTRALCERLWLDRQAGINTDLDVRCPEPEGEQGGPRTLHLHSFVAETSSEYFKTFKEPQRGRVIEDIPADTMEVCAHFMYFGDAAGAGISLDSVAAALNQVFHYTPQLVNKRGNTVLGTTGNQGFLCLFLLPFCLICHRGLVVRATRR